MKNLKIIRGIAFCLTVCLLMSITILAVPFKVSADNLTTSPTEVGTCGTNAYWEYYEDSKTLYIHGTGGITSSPGGTYKANIREIIVGDDITSIRFGAFKECTNLEEITLPFIGKSRDACGPEAVLGYIFGYETIHIFDIYAYTSLNVKDSYHCYIRTSWGVSADYYFGANSAGCLYRNDIVVRDERVVGNLISTYNPNVLVENQLGMGIPDVNGGPGNPSGTIWQFSAFDYLSYYNEINNNLDKAWLRSYYYYIPQTLQTVNITSIDAIPQAAFNNCKNLSEINIYSYISTWGNYAYSGCSATVNYLGGRYYTPKTYSNGIYTLTYILPNEEITITKCETTSESVVIPQSISNYPITAIGSNAFADMVNIKSVVIPTTVTSIADSAFYCCTSLTDVYYNGTKADWEKISIEENNGYLLNATIHFPVIAVSSVTLNKSSLEMWSGDEETLQATISPSDASEQGVSWVSLDPMVATVDNGIVRAIGKGKTTIIATTKDGNKTAECAVTVHRGASVEEFKIWETNYNSEGLSQEELYNRSHTLDVSWSPIVNRYSDTEDYDMYSMVLFSIVSEDNKSYSYTCKPSEASEVYSDQRLRYTLPAGKSYTVTATLRVGYNKNGYFVEKGSYTSNTITIDLPECSYYNTSFEVQYLTEQATCGSPAKYYANCEHCGVNYDKIVPHGEVDPNNHVYGKWLSIDVHNHRRSCECASKSETEPHTYENRVCVDCGVEDSRIYVNEVSLNKASVELNIGESEALIVTVDPADATNKAVTWTSSDPSVATVTNGTVTALKAGTTTITVTTVDGSKTATCVVTVNEAHDVDADVTYTIASASGKPGDIIELALSVSSDVTVNGLLLDNLNYDKNALEFVEFTEYGDLITTSALGTNGVDFVKGEIALGYTDAVKPNGEICVIKFLIKDTAEDGEYTISIDGVASANGQKLPSKVDSGKITISKWVSGDFDSDEKLDMKDVVYFMNWINFSWTGKYPVVYEGDKDFNKDGNIDMKDVVYFMNWVNFSWTGNYDINW